jgi:hypothetical protein
VGVQPVRYIHNIEKFHVAYTLSLELGHERARQVGGRR